MATDRVLSCASGIDTNTRPTIPHRSSSISHLGKKLTLGHNTKVLRHSLLLDDGRELNFLKTIPDTVTQDAGRSLRGKGVDTASNMMPRSKSCGVPKRRASHSTGVQRWAGLTRTVSNWDNIRKDPDLWSQDGDCYVHLYARGASRRGPSFCVPLRALRHKNCGAMLKVCYAHTVAPDSAAQEPQQMHSFDDLNRDLGLIELYIPAPEHTSREDSFKWHITTRNFFAFILGKPLVGEHMGQALVDLQERIQLFRPELTSNHQDLLQYAEDQGYRDLVDCTDYALANLYYAENYKLKDVWIDAFAHCVGMNDNLAAGPEYTLVSRLTKALIKTAYLEVDIRLRSVHKAIQTFLQDDLSPAYLGLKDGARNHLVRFRRFMLQAYIQEYGYWPPPELSLPFPKALYKSLLRDFQNLYDYLVDTSSTPDISAQKPASGEICILQNVDSFDKRHKFTPQPHPLPLLPHYAPHSASSASRQLSRASSSTSQLKRAEVHSKSAALAAATNNLDSSRLKSKMVQAYMRFERKVAVHPIQREDKLSVVDARRVRWLLIYGTLQYLVSALRAPEEVRDKESADYPLCCLVTGQSSYFAPTPVATPSTTPMTSNRAADDYFETSQSTESSIQPDCQREDYFSSRDLSRRGTLETSATHKSSLPSQPSSRLGLRPLSSLSMRSSRRNSLVLKPTSHCPIVVQGYGHGLHQVTRSPDAVHNQTVDVYEAHDPTNIDPTNHLGPLRTRTPLLNPLQLEQNVQVPQTEVPVPPMVRSDSVSSIGSSVWTNEGSAASSKSSAEGERPHLYKSAAEHSDLLGGLVLIDGSPMIFESPECRAPIAGVSQADVHPLLRDCSGFDFNFGNQSPNATASTGTSQTTQYPSASKPTLPYHVQESRHHSVPITSVLAGPSDNIAHRERRSTNAGHPTPTVTKTSHAANSKTKPNTLKKMVRENDKKESTLSRRVSSLWRR